MTKRVKRRITCLPNAVYFKPRGIPVCDLEVVELTLNELEAARLIDLEKLEQEEAAHKMGCECLNARIACIDGTPRLALEELVKKVALKDLRTEAKKHGIPAACRTKIDIAKDLPRTVLEKLVSK